METMELVRDLIGRGLQPGEPRTKGGLVRVALFASRRTENDVGRSPGGPIAGPTDRGRRRRHR